MCVLDAALTLLGQSEDYWRGRGSAEELSPDARHLLQIGPGVFALGIVGWILVMSILLALLPRAGALFAAVSIAIAHSAGGCSWLWKMGAYQAGVGICILAAGLLIISLLWDEQATSVRGRRPPPPSTRTIRGEGCAGR